MQNKYLNYIIIQLMCMLICSSVFAQGDLDYYQKARAEGKKLNFKKATEYCLAGLKESPNDLDLKEYLGKCYLETNKLDQARMTLLDVLRKSPDRDDARRYLVNVETQSKRYASAICYVNELLETNQYNKDLWLKKVNLYSALYNDVEAEKAIKRLLQIFPNDKKVRDTYNEIMKKNIADMVKKENLENAVKQYEEVIASAKKDPEMYLNLINTQISLGRMDEALVTANKGVNFVPQNTSLLAKKASILEAQGKTDLAIESLESFLKKNSNTTLQKQLNYLKSQFASKMANNDPYILYSKLYEKKQADPVTVDYLINTAIERGKFDDAQQFLLDVLKRNPSNKKYLIKQLELYERSNNTGKAKSVIENLYNKFPTDKDIEAKYAQLKYDEGKDFMRDKNYAPAIENFRLLAAFTEYQLPAQENLTTCYIESKKYKQAYENLADLSSKYPMNEKYRLLQIELLTTMGDYENAFQQLKLFRQNFGSTNENNEMTHTVATHYIKYLNQLEKYDRIAVIADDAIAQNPNDLQMYIYKTNAYTQQRDFNAAQNTLQEALLISKNDKNLRLRLADILASKEDFEQSTELLSQLKDEYPHNDTIHNAYSENMMRFAKQAEINQNTDHALLIYEKLFLVNPKSVQTSMKLSNLLLANGHHAKALLVIDQCLQNNPNQNELIYQKAIIYEKEKNYPEALKFYTIYSPNERDAFVIKEHIQQLRARNLTNEITASYTHVKSDSVPVNISVASLEYSIKANPYDMFVGRFNYAGKNSGVGVQGELDWHHRFRNNASILLNVGASSRFFQKFKSAFSYFQPLPKDWQLEFGGRYAILSNDANFYTGIFGVEKTFNTVWFNLKGFYMNDSKESYYNVFSQCRFYLVNEKDYLTIMGSVGNAPEDQRLDFQLNNFLSYANSMVGAGYKRYISARSAISFIGNWYNFKMQSSSYLNQYNVNISFSTKF